MGRSGLSASVCPFITLVWLQNRNGCPGCQHAYDIDFLQQKCYSTSLMKRMRETLAVVAASAALISGDTAQPTLAEMAPDARLEIAQRYAACAIREVVLNTAVFQAGDRHPRNRLDIAVEVKKTPQAEMYEKIYAEDDTVVWDEPVGSTAVIDRGAENATTEFGLGQPVTNGRDLLPLEGENNAGVLTWYPRNDYTPGTRMHVYVTNHTQTYTLGQSPKPDPEPESVGFTYCGTLQASAENGKVTAWEPQGNFAGLNSVVFSRECELVPFDNQPGAFNTECPDWQQVR
jgi:hypothetical protein